MSTSPREAAQRKVWYYARNKQKFGPYTNAELKQLAERGQILPSDMLKHADRAQWAPASAIKGLLGPAQPSNGAPLKRGPLTARKPRRKRAKKLLAACLFLMLATAGASWFFWAELAPYVEQARSLVAARDAVPSPTQAEETAATPAADSAPALEKPSATESNSDANTSIEDPALPGLTAPANPPKKGQNDADFKLDMPASKLPTPPLGPKPSSPQLPDVPLQTERPDRLPRHLRTALDWIAKNQEADGRWKTDWGNNRPAITAVTSFCALALLGDGDRYQTQVDKAAQYVSANLFDDYKKAARPMLDQSNWTIGIGGLFICEYYAALKKRDASFTSADLDRVLEKLVSEVCERMEASGGWGHTPRVKNPLNYVELQIVGNWMLATLGACQQLGVKVPPEKVALALKFVENCCKPGEGGVGYSPRQGQKGFGDVCLTGGALFGFGLLGKTNHPLYPKMVKFVDKEMKNANEGHASVAMGYLSAALGAFQAGDAEWEDFSRRFFPILRDGKNRDGSFTHQVGQSVQAKGGFDDKIGTAYNTGIYALVFMIERNNLAFIGQRQGGTPLAAKPADEAKPMPDAKVMPKPATKTPDPKAMPKPAAEETDPGGKPAVRDPATAKKVKLALDWLVKSQQADGHWKTGMGDNRDAILVTTSFNSLALMASGGPYQNQVSRAANYILDNLFVDKSGIKGPPEWDQSNWKIGIGGLFLCEYYHWLKAKDARFRSLKPQLEKLIQQCVDESCKRMEASGGWGHTPRLKNALGYIELEIMSDWHLPMLAAAKQIGLKVPKDKIDLALQFIENCCEPGEGGVGYSPREGQRGNGCPCLTGGALFGFAVAGQQERPIYPKMVDFWKRNIQDSNEAHASLALGFLCSALGARQIGAEAWDPFVTQFFPQIVAAQDADGSFKVINGKSFKAQVNSDRSVGVAYTTGIYALLLQLDNGKLKYLGQKQD